MLEPRNESRNKYNVEYYILLCVCRLLYVDIFLTLII